MLIADRGERWVQGKIGKGIKGGRKKPTSYTQTTVSEGKQDGEGKRG